jgi:hypothetical protein
VALWGRDRPISVRAPPVTVLSPRGQPLTYDFSVITEEGCHDLLGLSLPVPSSSSWRAEIDGKRFSGMMEIDGSFWAISLKAQSAPGSKWIVMS